MKKLLCCLVCISMIQFASAQTKPAPAVKSFIDALNDLLKAAPKVDWMGTKPMGVDSFFHLSGDSLSYTLSYGNSDESYHIRFVAPLSKIDKLDTDYFLVLWFTGNHVNIYRQAKGASSWSLEEQSAMMHIARVEDVPADIRQLRSKAEQAFAKWKSGK